MSRNVPIAPGTPNHRSTSSAQRTEIKINVYDLLPPGKLSSLLWTIGGSLLHSGVEIKGKEYAYGGHNRPGLTGVYWTRPRLEPPGGTFRCEVLQGVSDASDEEIESIIKEASLRFQGITYNLLSNNCNHFTSYLCEKLTSRPAPAWINRAANIGIALPCVVPKEWIAPPDYDTADGELVEDEDDDDETAAMLSSGRRRQSPSNLEDRGREDLSRHSVESDAREDLPQEPSASKDTSGRLIPTSERAPIA